MRGNSSAATKKKILAVRGDNSICWIYKPAARISPAANDWKHASVNGPTWTFENTHEEISIADNYRIKTFNFSANKI